MPSSLTGKAIEYSSAIEETGSAAKKMAASAKWTGEFFIIAPPLR
jgi:hypothetical protein